MVAMAALMKNAAIIDKTGMNETKWVCNNEVPIKNIKGTKWNNNKLFALVFVFL